MKLKPTIGHSKEESERIVNFLVNQLKPSGRAVVAVSGGVDSDLVARLTVAAIGPGQTKLFTVVQQDMEARHLNNARLLAKDLGVPLVELHLAELPAIFIHQMAQDDPTECFRPDGLLDPARAKCSMRTVVLSTYQDRGYVVVGASNRTELLTGFFLPFGDALCHLAPIAHLYKTQVRALAAISGTRQHVLDQPASAGFWPDQDDLEDLAWWLYCQSPIGTERQFDEHDEAQVEQIRNNLSTQALDLALMAINDGKTNGEIAQTSGLSVDIVKRLQVLIDTAIQSKHRPLSVGLEPNNAY